MGSKEHWEGVFKSKDLNEVSWYQDNPESTVSLISSYVNQGIVIDVGCGDSALPGLLAKHGYRVTALDISQAGIDKAAKRAGKYADLIDYRVNDVLNFKSYKQYDVWHDRAVLHFLSDDESVETYKSVLVDSLKPRGLAIISVFSKNGPPKCSGIEVRKYNAEDFQTVFGSHFALLDATYYDHETPFGSTQNFCRVVMQKK